MAWVNQEKKAKVAAELSRVVPKSWKWSLAVRDHSTIVMTVKAAPLDIIKLHNDTSEYKADGHISINPYHFKDHYPMLAPVLEPIFDALNTDNHDNSDLMTDYFDVGHYVELRFGRWDKPYTVLQ